MKKRVEDKPGKNKKAKAKKVKKVKKPKRPCPFCDMMVHPQNYMQHLKRLHAEKVEYVGHVKKIDNNGLVVQCPYCAKKIQIDDVLNHQRKCDSTLAEKDHAEDPSVICSQCGINVKWSNIAKHTMDVHTPSTNGSAESVGTDENPYRPGYIYCYDCEKYIPKRDFKFHAPCLPPSNSIKALRGGLPD